MGCRPRESVKRCHGAIRLTEGGLQSSAPCCCSHSARLGMYWLSDKLQHWKGYMPSDKLSMFPHKYVHSIPAATGI